MHESEGTAALAACAWFNALVSAPAARDITAMFDAMRGSRHYVLGRKAPFGWRLAAVEDTEDIEEGGLGLVAALWGGQHAGNLAGNMQGGAICAAFDAVVATVGSVAVEPMRFGTTKSLHVVFRRPVPLATVLKIHATAAGGFDLDTGVARVSAVLSDGQSGEIYASCTAEMVDLKRRMRWKHEAKSKI